MSFISIARFIFICLEVVLLFNVLIFVHELGHFLAARWRGLYVDEFALWFGKPLWRRKIGGVWFAINSIPAGGYVKLPQMAPMDALEGEAENLPPEAKVPIRPLDKIIVAFAGPLFSFLLAVVFAVIVWQVGRPVREAESTTTIGYLLPGSPAAKAGLKPGDVMTEIDGNPVRRWQGMSSDSVVWRIVTSEGEKLQIKYVRDGKEHVVAVKPEIPPTKIYQRRGTRQLLIAPAETPLVEKVEPGSAAEKAGLRRGDLILGANDQPIYGFETIADVARANPDAPVLLKVSRDDQSVTLTEPFVLTPPIVETVFENSPGALAGVRVGDRIERINDSPVFSTLHIIEWVEQHGEQPLTLHVSRGAEKLALSMTPAIPLDEKRPKLGLQFREDPLGLTLNENGRRSIIHPPPLEQIRLSTLSIVNTLGAILSSKSDVSAQHLGGPVMMMRIYYVLFESPDGWRLALWFSVLLNVNLALLNMLPLPVLDGGHITLAILESIRRRPIEGRILQWIQTACAMLLIGFMLFITFFDVQDLFGERRAGMKFAPKAEAVK